MLDNIKNILMIRRGAYGDIIFTLPCYHLLKANFPNSKITYLAKNNYAEILKGFPGLDDIITIKKKEYHTANPIKLWEIATDLFHTVKAGNFQLAIDFVGHGEQAFLLWACGIENRWGSIKTNKPIRQFFYTEYFTRNQPEVHLTDQHLSLLAKGGLTHYPINNQYVIPEENLEKARYLFQEWGLSFDTPAIYIQPFTGDGVPGKMWPIERYAAVADYWRKQGVQVLFGGGPAERELLNSVAGQFPIAAGRADFVTSIALASLCSFILGGDTGLLHAATAVGKRVVMLVGPTNPLRAGPYRHPEWAVKPPSGTLIEDVSIEKVIEATQTAFDEIGKR